ncbi:RNA methyltransferase [Mycobacterium sp. CBMA293]|uniref:TrmH family RNA methyltransferase n=1 Tax=unclassified Mycolicibacterium TaxID=2636767 RepID=UPI001326F0D1|nr:MULTISPECIES: RNA methyltransferase [unclassified Mycolicibacterium]MUL45140.1 RNA methyltransferase [Mycolicibacterium sp. CBMA 360]MUL91745.1 RNA methyltransferase [Mycolicibacterium sp. CBMA 230]MUM34347.1 RNA methyltransferase [Mycolicibacterium sp. CBMA 361]MUL56658.1 RNA methyltransferase [Mycolicibacterium sp. CBMA 335]MUL69697.1 RNA methyltransferase [Mycolicibacterium sp. CBMA 311]
MVAAAKLQRHVGRKRAGRFLAEGPNLVEAALRRGLVSEVFATSSAAERFSDLLAGAPVSVVTEKAAKALSETVTPVGLVAVCALPEESLESVLASAPRLLAVAIGMSEPGNAGTLIRIADAMGADAVVFAGHSVDPYNGKCLRSSAGSIFSLPVVVDSDAAAVVSAIRESGVEVLATALDASIDIRSADLTARTAWLFGPEAHGLPADVAAMASQRVHIPMRGSAESLNVAAAASICLYESSRAQS